MKQKNKDTGLMIDPVIYTTEQLRTMKLQELEDAMERYCGYLLTRGVSEEASTCFAEISIMYFMRTLKEHQRKENKNGKK